MSESRIPAGVALLLSALLYTQAATSDTDIRISADSMRFDYATGSSIYSGKVRIEKGGIVLSGDEVITEKGRDGKELFRVRGRPARYSQRQEGEVIEASSEDMSFDLDTEILTLEHSAQLLHQGQLIRSDLIRFDTRGKELLAGKTDAVEPGQRVNITLTPPKKE